MFLSQPADITSHTQLHPSQVLPLIGSSVEETRERERADDEEYTPNEYGGENTFISISVPRSYVSFLPLHQQSISKSVRR